MAAKVVKSPKTRQDLIARITRSSWRAHPIDSRELLKVIAFLEAKDWSGALKAARSMDTDVRERIPQWGWDMMRNTDAALNLLQQVG